MHGQPNVKIYSQDVKFICVFLYITLPQRLNEMLGD